MGENISGNIRCRLTYRRIAEQQLPSNDVIANDQSDDTENDPAGDEVGDYTRVHIMPVADAAMMVHIYNLVSGISDKEISLAVEWWKRQLLIDQ